MQYYEQMLLLEGSPSRFDIEYRHILWGSLLDAAWNVQRSHLIGGCVPRCNLLDTKVSIHAGDNTAHKFLCFVIDEY